jgi:hypothetical protein
MPRWARHGPNRPSRSSIWCVSSPRARWRRAAGPRRCLVRRLRGRDLRDSRPERRGQDDGSRDHRGPAGADLRPHRGAGARLAKRPRAHERADRHPAPGERLLRHADPGRDPRSVRLVLPGRIPARRAAGPRRAAREAAGEDQGALRRPGAAVLDRRGPRQRPGRRLPRRADDGPRPRRRGAISGRSCARSRPTARPSC